MRTLFSMISLALVLAAPAGAHQIRYDDIQNEYHCPFSGGCVDAWKVQCTFNPSNVTGWIRSRVRDRVDGDFNFFDVSAIGIGGPQAVLGVADVEGNVFNESFTFSDPAWVGKSDAAEPMTALALVKIGSGTDGSATPEAYVVEFACVDAVGAEVGEPTVTLLQDQ